MQPTFSVIQHETGEFEQLKNILDEIAKAAVYVGIPEEKTEREYDYEEHYKNAPPTNAGLLFIHTHGSELMGIPARPVIEPAIENDRETLEEMLAKVAKAYLDGDLHRASELLEKTGQRGANDAKRWFRNSANGWPPNKPATIRRKILKANASSPKRAARLLRLLLEGAYEDTTLIDTSQMRNAITYVTDFQSIEEGRTPQPSTEESNTGEESEKVEEVEETGEVEEAAEAAEVAAVL